MDTIDELIDLDEAITKATKEVFESFPPQLKESAFPKASQLLFYLVQRIDQIKSGIFDVSSFDNNYSSNILMRSLLEHCLTAMYVIERWSDERSDAIGDDYYTHRYREEEIDYWESNLKVLRIAQLDGALEEGKKNIYEERFPYLKEMPKKKLKEMNQKFKVGKMILYSLRNINFKEIDPNEDIPALDNLKYFSHIVQLSSYVHGGPLAEEFFIKYQDKDKLKDKLYETCDTAFSFANGIKELSLLIFSQLTGDKKFHDLADTIKDLRDDKQK